MEREIITKPSIENFKSYSLSLFLGYVTAWYEEFNILSMVLLRYSEKELRQEWHREADIHTKPVVVKNCFASLLHHRWHSKGK